MKPSEIIEQANALRDEWEEQCAEDRACGYETVSFDQFVGARDAKQDAMSIWKDRFDNDTADLY